MKPALSLIVAAAACAGLLGPASGADRATDGNQRAAAGSRTSDITRGEYLARIGDCISCHTARGGQPFAGGLALETGFGACTRRTLRPIWKPASASGPRTISGTRCTRVIQGRHSAVSGLPLYQLHQGHARGFGCDLRLPQGAEARAPAESRNMSCASPTTSASC
jgi:hypothetical protein